MIHERFREGISEAEKYDYEDEQLLLVGDWYHRSAVDVQTSYPTLMSSGNEVCLLRRAIATINTDSIFSLFRIRFSSMGWDTLIALWPFPHCQLNAKMFGCQV